MARNGGRGAGEHVHRGALLLRKFWVPLFTRVASVVRNLVVERFNGIITAACVILKHCKDEAVIMDPVCCSALSSRLDFGHGSGVDERALVGDAVQPRAHHHLRRPLRQFKRKLIRLPSKGGRGAHRFGLMHISVVDSYTFLRFTPGRVEMIERENTCEFVQLIIMGILSSPRAFFRNVFHDRKTRDDDDDTLPRLPRSSSPQRRAPGNVGRRRTSARCYGTCSPPPPPPRRPRPRPRSRHSPSRRRVVQV